MGDKVLSKEDQAYVELLDTVSEELTKKILTPEYSHYIDMWKAVLGGFVCKERAKYIPVSPEDQALIDTYTPEKIRLLSSGKTETVEVAVEKIVEKKVTVEKIVHVPVDASGVVPSAGGNATGNMRYKPAGVNKESKKKRELSADEHQVIIERFNQEQSLVDKTNPICTQISATFNNGTSDEVFPYQVAGYWSWLCKMAVSPTECDKWFQGSTKLGKLPVGCPRPVATLAFQKVILDNLARMKALDAHRKSFNQHMAAGPTVQPAKTATLPAINGH